MKGKSAGGHEKPVRGNTNEWHTPVHILDALGPFDLDPAMPGSSDGLTKPWRGFVWLNPPYGPEVGLWLFRLARHGNGIAIVYARTETKWFQREIWSKADALLFLHNRIKFVKNGIEAKGNAGAPSVLVAYGNNAKQRLLECDLRGTYIDEWSHSDA